MNVLEFIEAAGKLKKAKRTGWVAKGVSDPESVAEHSYRSALIVMLLGKELGINVEKAIKMALIHDLAEAVTGDFRKKPDENDQELTNKKQFELEKNALQGLVSTLPRNKANEIFDLWIEYNEEITPESVAVKDIGKLEMALQAYEYEKDKNHQKSLQEFFAYSKDRIKTPKLRQLLKEIEKKRL